MKFTVEKGLLQFLLSDDVGRYAIVSAPGKRDFELRFQSGISKQVSFVDFGSKPKDGDKVYFDSEGTFSSIVKKSKAVVNEGKGGMGSGSCKAPQHAF
ncbi:hypothetical protein TOTORO_00750 [Serratia phage vB_SmaS-Totoro]|nr:hypothetical protein TOTORO_00750 [Serratia phage vB_SmaS-Totoro]